MRLRSSQLSSKRSLGETSDAQREKVRDRGCVVCQRRPVDAMHLWPRSLIASRREADDPLAVLPGCREHHVMYDARGLDLLPFLVPDYRQEIAFAVFLANGNLAAVYKRLTGGGRT